MDFKKNEDCKKWMEEFLMDNGRTEIDIVRNSARIEGFTRGNITYAKKELRLICTNDYNKITKKTTEYYWQLRPTEQ